MKNAHRKIQYLGTLAFFLMVQPTNAQQTAKSTVPVKGVVKTYAKPHTPIANTEVGLEGIDSTDTSPQGEYTLGIPEQAKPTQSVVTFYVKNWKVIHPSLNGRWGSTYMPPPNADVTLEVALPGQREIFLTDASIETMLLGATYQFKKIISLQQQAVLSWDRLRFPVSLQLGGSLPGDEEALAKKYFSDWLDDAAKEIDISRTDIETAISSWIGRARSDFDRGLGFLYQGNLARATAALEAARKTMSQQKDLYIATHQALAFSYVFQRNYPVAEEVLRKAFAETNDSDQNFLFHLSHVLTIDGKPNEAKKALEQARAILRRNGISPSSSRKPDTTQSPPVSKGLLEVPAYIYYEGDMVIKRLYYGSKEIGSTIWLRRGSDKIRAKYFASGQVYQNYSAFNEQIVLVCSGAFTTQDLWGAVPQGLTVDNGTIVNRDRDSQMDGLVVVYPNGGIAVSDIAKENLQIEYSGGKRKVLDILKSEDKTAFLDWAQQIKASVFQTQLLASTRGLRLDPSKAHKELRERRFLAIVHDSKTNEVIHVIINVSTSFYLGELAKLVYEYLQSETKIIALLNLETGGYDILQINSPTGRPLSYPAGQQPISKATNLLVYYHTR